MGKSGEGRASDSVYDSVPDPTFTKTHYLAGLQCHKRLWLAIHQPQLAVPLEAGQQVIIEQGIEVGRAAHALFAGGVLIGESSRHFERAVADTRAQLEDPAVPALFEAAFEHEGVRIRCDVIDRLGVGRFGLCEVKSSTRVKDAHLPDLAIQLYVLRGAGLEVSNAELVHVDRRYVLAGGEIDWQRFFVREDLTQKMEARLDDIPGVLRDLRRIVARAEAPAVEPGAQCKSPVPCPFWKHCTARKSPTWFVQQMRAKAELRAHRIEAAQRSQPWISGSLYVALRPAEPPVWYLDFEALAPAIPIYRGTHPFQALPFQWSLHHLDANGAQTHFEFLARGDVDPCPETSDRLLDVLSNDDAPIVVYSPYESRMLATMALRNPDRAHELNQLRTRLFDLLPLVRSSVYFPAFRGSFSIKSVAPVLAPEVTYGDLGDVAEGNAAASAFTRIAAGGVNAPEEAKLRAALLAYCERDTRALMEVHGRLRREVGLAAE